MTKFTIRTAHTLMEQVGTISFMHFDEEHDGKASEDQY